MNYAKIAFFEELLLSHNCIHMNLKTWFIVLLSAMHTEIESADFQHNKRHVIC